MNAALYWLEVRFEFGGGNFSEWGRPYSHWWKTSDKKMALRALKQARGGILGEPREYRLIKDGEPENL